jgi:hypothetical protein
VSRSLAEHVLSDRAYALRGTTTAPSSFTSVLSPDLPIVLSAVFG